MAGLAAVSSAHLAVCLRSMSAWTGVVSDSEVLAGMIHLPLRVP